VQSQTKIFSRLVRDFMRTSKVVVPEETKVAELLGRMGVAKATSALVVDSDGRLTGIITEQDITRRVALRCTGGEGVPSVMTTPVETVGTDDYLFTAIARMRRFGWRQMPVVDAQSRPVGAIALNDALSIAADQVIRQIDRIAHEGTLDGMREIKAAQVDVASDLLADHVPATEIQALITSINSDIHRRVITAAITAMRGEGLGDPPVPFAVIVMGSGGRGESLLAMDQDNAIVFAEGEPGGATDRWFGRLGGMVADILHEVGVPYCEGGVMGSNEKWRGSLATWRARVSDWIGRSRPQDLLSVDIFFDLRGVQGDFSLANGLWREAFDMARDNVNFAKLLAETGGDVVTGLNFFGGFRTDQGRIDLKRAGLFAIVTTARVLAIRHHIVERSTPARLAGVMALDIGGKQDLTALIEAQATFLDLILAQQLDDLHHGLPPTNKVVSKRLARDDRERLRRALEAVRHLDTLTRELLFRA